MTFINEYISDSDRETYDLVKVCGERNLPSRRGRMHSRDWTIDRERDAFLIKVWAHQESEFSGYAFYWREVWVFFEMRPIDSRISPDHASCWYKFLVKNIDIPDASNVMGEELRRILREAITASPGGVTHHYVHRSATVEFVEE